MTFLRKGRLFYPLWCEATMHLCFGALSYWTFTLTRHFHTCLQRSGGWLDVLPLPPPSASGEAQQHRSPSNNPSSLLAALSSSVLTVSNPSFSLKLWCKSTALHEPTRVMGHAGCVQTPSSPVPLLFFESACNS